MIQNKNIVSYFCCTFHMAVFLSFSVFPWHILLYVQYPNFSLVIRTPGIGLRCHLSPVWPQLNLANYLYEKPYLQIRSHSEVLGLRLQHIFFGEEHDSTHALPTCGQILRCNRSWWQHWTSESTHPGTCPASGLANMWGTHVTPSCTEGSLR